MRMYVSIILLMVSMCGSSLFAYETGQVVATEGQQAPKELLNCTYYVKGEAAKEGGNVYTWTTLMPVELGLFLVVAKSILEKDPKAVITDALINATDTNKQGIKSPVIKVMTDFKGKTVQEALATILHQPLPQQQAQTPAK